MNDSLYVMDVTLFCTDFVNTLQKVVPKHLFTMWENHFRHAISQLPLNVLQQGLSELEQLGAISKACELTADTIGLQINSSQYAQYFWNPVVASMFSSMKHSITKTSEKGSFKRKTSAILETSKVSKSPQKASNAPSKQKTKNNSSSDKSSKQKISRKDKAAAIAQPIPDSAYTELEYYISNQQHVYGQDTPVVCNKPKCTFCVSLAKHLPMTKCIGHAPCLESGWFPHVGKGLWARLKKSHERKSQSNGIWKPAGQYELKPHERRTLIQWRSNDVSMSVEPSDNGSMIGSASFASEVAAFKASTLGSTPSTRSQSSRTCSTIQSKRSRLTDVSRYTPVIPISSKALSRRDK